MKTYPVYYQGKKVLSAWNPLVTCLYFELLMANIKLDQPTWNLLVYFEKDQVVIVHKMAGEGG